MNLVVKARELLYQHEGVRAFPYDDATGKPIVVGGYVTIGVGRNLNAKPLTEDEIDYLLSNDVADAIQIARDVIGSTHWYKLSEPRQLALVDMAFNLGPRGLAGFTKMLEAMRDGDYTLAAKEALESKWAKQVGQRALTVAKMIGENETPDYIS